MMRTLFVWGGLVWLALGHGSVRAQAADPELALASQAAMEAFHALEIESARVELENAVRSALERGVRGPELARAYANLGIVLSSGLGERASAVAVFRRALAEDPLVKPDPRFSTPEVQALFAQAVEEQALATATPEAPERVSAREGGLGALCDRERVCAEGLVCRAAICSLESPVRPVPPRPPARAPRVFARAALGSGSALLVGHPALDRGPPDALRARVAEQDAEAAMATAEAAGWACSTLESEGAATELHDCTVSLGKSGFVTQLMLELLLGLDLGERVYLAASLRLQPLGHGQGALAGLLLGARVGYWLARPPERGLTSSLLLGVGAGSIQVSPKPQALGEPWVTSGLFAVQLGGTLGYRFTRHVGLSAAVQAHALLPDWLVALDLSVGPELAF